MDKPKVIFVRYSASQKYSLTHPRDNVIPLNIAYAASLLMKSGYVVEVVDNAVDGLRFKQLCQRILDRNGEIIFIEAVIVSALQVEELAGALKEAAPQIKAIFAMTEHAGILPDSLIHEHSPIDACVMGEYDYTVGELVSVFTLPHSPNGFSRIKGIAYFDKKNKNLVINPMKEYILSLDEMPFLNYRLFNIDRYKKPSAQIFSYRKLRWGFLLTSRGCPYRKILT